MPRRKFEKDKKDKKKLKRVVSKRVCRFCVDSENIIDFKRTRMLCSFLNDRCKIAPRRVTGNCQFHQRRIVQSIKRARHLALLPYTVQHALPR